MLHGVALFAAGIDTPETDCFGGRELVNAKPVVSRLKSMANPANTAGMARFGINPQGTLGIAVTDLRKIAKECGRDHDLAVELWASGIHEARILASMVDIPDLVTDEQMESWVEDFDSWDVVDQCCNNLFRRTKNPHAKVTDWAGREEEFVKRAAFALMAALAVHDKRASDDVFEQYFSLIRRESTDERNFVKKAVNWALRQIGKRTVRLNDKAIVVARELSESDSRSARWIGKDAFKELTSDRVRDRLPA